MKKILFNLILICAVLSSCKKDHKEITPVSTVHKVAFSVAFAQSTGIISNSNRLSTNSLTTNSTPDTSLTNHISTIYYMVFDSAGNLVHNIKQLSTDTAFGHYTDNLHTGKYTIAVSGSGAINLLVGNLSQEYLYGNFTSDVFFERLTLTVGGTDINQSLSLNRITSKFVVNINDAIPANAGYGKITLTSAGTNYYIANDHISGASALTYTYTIPASAAGTTNYQMTGQFLYMSPFEMDIAVAQSGAAGATLYGDRAVTNVTGQANSITLLSGNLFGGSGGGASGFQVLPDTAWKTPVIQTFP